MIITMINNVLLSLPSVIIAFFVFKYQFHTTKDYLLILKENDIDRKNTEIELLKYKYKTLLTDEEKEIQILLNERRNCLIEHYFNTLDIICYEYLHWKLDRKEFISMYKSFLIETVEENVEEFNSLDCRHNNIIKVYNKLL